SDGAPREKRLGIRGRGWCAVLSIKRPNQISQGADLAAHAFWPGTAAGLNQGTYSDGSPRDALHYVECKLILKPDRFTCVNDFHEFGNIVRQAADECGVGFSTKRAAQLKPRIREVLFLDTGDFRFYNKAFILRRRITYEDGFPVGDPEIVFKFRHPDLASA